MSTQPPTACVALTEQMIKSKSKADRLAEVKSLNLWGQDLSDVSLLAQLTAVEVLSLSVNNISSLQNFSSCQKLQELYLRKNEIADIAEVAHLAQLPDLRVLWLSDNPCAQIPEYRAKVLQMLPQLHKLDNDDVAQAPSAEAGPAKAEGTPAPLQPQEPPSVMAPKAGLASAGEAHSNLPAAAPSHQATFQPEKVALIAPNQLPTFADPAKSQQTAGAPAAGRSNVLYAVIALLAELDHSSLHIVQAEVQQRLQGQGVGAQ